MLKRYLTNPQALVHGNKMPFAGIANPNDRDNVVAYLQTLYPSCGCMVAPMCRAICSAVRLPLAMLWGCSRPVSRAGLLREGSPNFSALHSF